MDSKERNSENPRRPRQGSGQDGRKKRPAQNPAKTGGQSASRRSQPQSRGQSQSRTSGQSRGQSQGRTSSQPNAHQQAVRRKVAEVNSRNQRQEAARAAKVKAMRRRAEEKQTPRRQVRKPHRPMQPVVYTEPKAFNRNRFFVQIISIMAIVMALILSLSIFFKVETITVSGANVYSAWTVREASGIEEGDNLLTFSRARASARIQTELPYVESVRIGIKLPNTVNIEITEASVVYAIQDVNGGWWLMTSDGRVTEQSDSASAGNYTKVLGVTLDSPVVGEQATAYQTGTSSGDSTEDSTEETIVAPVTVTAAQRLEAALQILQALEDNDIVGTVASVDVTSLSDIELWYGTRYQVTVGDTSQLDYKIACMSYAILELSDYETGILDVSFITWPDEVSYTPFE